ncbi:hypothetical protein MPSEU_000004200 [Mayamaea pseudoterrestris]|nr:hypothetical protein MPSEU_000004200 [Mayamaea pseudoterrestris]
MKDAHSTHANLAPWLTFAGPVDYCFRSNCPHRIYLFDGMCDRPPSDSDSCGNTGWNRTQDTLSDDDRAATIHEMLEALEALRLQEEATATANNPDPNDEFMHNILSVAINIAAEYENDESEGGEHIGVEATSGGSSTEDIDEDGDQAHSVNANETEATGQQHGAGADDRSRDRDDTSNSEADDI